MLESGCAPSSAPSFSTSSIIRTLPIHTAGRTALASMTLQSLAPASAAVAPLPMWLPPTPSSAPAAVAPFNWDLSLFFSEHTPPGSGSDLHPTPLFRTGEEFILCQSHQCIIKSLDERRF